MTKAMDWNKVVQIREKEVFKVVVEEGLMFSTAMELVFLPVKPRTRKSTSIKVKALCKGRVVYRSAMIRLKHDYRQRHKIKADSMIEEIEISVHAAVWLHVWIRAK